MQLKTVFTVNYIYAFLFGAGFIFFPAFCGSLVGFDLAGDASLIARCMGIFVLFSGVLTFSCRDAEESRARRAILLSLIALYVLLILFKVLLNTLWGFPLDLMFVLLYLFHLGLIASYGYHLVGTPTAMDS
jgi:NADH:ubiquinone oxidoreductase subunit 6 (subunit J)